MASKYYAPYVITAIDQLLENYQKDKSTFETIFLKLKSKHNRVTKLAEDIKIYRQLNVERYMSQMTVLAKHPKNTMAVSINGMDHLVAVDQLDAGAANYVRSELAKGSHQNHYAILAMTI